MRGRKPVPTKLKILHGNPGKRPLNDREPRTNPEAPPCPPHLGKDARKKWRQLVAELRGMGLLSSADQAILALFCVVWTRWVKAETTVAQTGEVLKSKETGAFYQNPYLAVANRALEQLTRLGSLLGLDPSSRSRIKAGDAPDRGADPLGEWMNGKAN